MAVADLTFLDQRVAALHLFPVALLLGLAWTCRQAILGRTIGIGLLGPPAASSAMGPVPPQPAS